jgi:2-C-methyl-D-erythritol 4-phosphate cytidylyltransferase
MQIKAIAIIPAAGVGRRFDPEIIKTFVSLGNMPVLAHTIQRLHNEEAVHEILPVLREEDADIGHDMVREFNFTKVNQIAAGGPERQDSIFNALKILQEREIPLSGETLILIHDGARPLIPKGLIKRLSEEIRNFDAVVPGIQVKDTLKEVSPDGTVLSTLDRGAICAVQTPQAFRFQTIKTAYERACSEQFYATDDAALVERMGGRVKIIEGDENNIKITTREDLIMAEDILARGIV